MGYIAGIDIGGTHTDCVASDGRGVQVAKVATTADPTDGVLKGITILAEKFGANVSGFLGNCDRFVYGSTTATNVFVQRRLPKTGLLCTDGHRDILWFREGNKPDRWDLRAPPPWSLLDRHLRLPVGGRIDCNGQETSPLQEEDVLNACKFFQNEDVEAIAIAFLWSFMNADHERRVQEIVREQIPNIPVVVRLDASGLKCCAPCK